MFNPIVEQRKQNKLKLFEMIKNNEGINRERVLALFSLQTGLKRRTVAEYLDELISAGLIEEDERVHSKNEPKAVQK